jgi:hypothetical protein
MRFITPLLLCLICSPLFGQIKLTEQTFKTNETWTGYLNPVINADGSITSGPGSKPVLAKPSVTTIKYQLETPVPYKFYMLEVFRIPTNEKVQVDKDPAGEIYSFRSGATTGKYRFDYIGFDPEKGIFKDSIEVSYTVPPPSPGNEPVVPGVVLEGVSEEARIVMLNYVKNMAKDLRTIASELKTTPTLTSKAVQTRGQALDLVTRTSFKEAIGAVINRHVGDTPKPEQFEAIAIGYEAVK